MNSLAKDLPLEDKVPEGAYEVHISRELPSLFQVVRVTARGALHCVVSKWILRSA